MQADTAVDCRAAYQEAVAFGQQQGQGWVQQPR